MKKTFKRIITITLVIISLIAIILYIATLKTDRESKMHRQQLIEYKKAILDSLSSTDYKIKESCAYNHISCLTPGNYIFTDTLAEYVYNVIKQSNNAQLIFDGAKSIGSLWDDHPKHLRDSDRAYKMAYLYMLAAEIGHPTAQGEFSRCLMDGFGTSRNLNMAYYWAKKSAEANDIVGIYALGTCLVHGYGTLIDKNRGAKLLRQAENAGYERAHIELMKNY